MRPIYESKKDLDEEAKLVAKLAGGKTVIKLPPLRAVDYGVADSDGAILKFYEIKRRYNPWKKYKTYIISANKIAACQALHFATGVPVYLAIQWDDAYGTMRVLEEPLRCFMGGRKDRGDKLDIEIMNEYPMGLFDLVEEGT